MGQQKGRNMFSFPTHGLWFFYDDEISIYWTRDDSFEVYKGEKQVDRFVTAEKPKDSKQAEQFADEWLADILQEEKLRHADIN
jgi:hypothetical protein